MKALQRLMSSACIVFAIALIGSGACQKQSRKPGSNETPTLPLKPIEPKPVEPKPPLPNAPDSNDVPDNLAPLPEAQVCAEGLEAPAADATCVQTFKGKSDLTYIEGTLLSYDRPIEGGGILYNAKGTILCSGCGCRKDAIAQEATRISCPKGVISPGLINAHDHLAWAAVKPGNWGDERFEHRNDWRGGKRDHKKVSVPKSGAEIEVALGEIRQLMTGTVSIAGSSAVGGFVRNLDDERYLEGLITEPVNYNTFPLEGSGDYDFRMNDCAYSRQKYLADLTAGRNLMHVSEGIDDAARNEFLCLSRSDNGGFDVTKANNSYVHAIGLLAQDAQVMASQGTAVVWSPRSNIALYGNTAPVTLYRNLGISIALGTDWTPSGSAHLTRELQCAATLNARNFNFAFSDHELWLMVTARAASALKVEQRLGRLDPGWVADIAVYRRMEGRNPYQSIFRAEARETALVVRAGQTLFGEAALVDSTAQNCQEIDVCGVSKKLCYDSQSAALKAKGVADFAAFQVAIKDAYPLFFCTKPTDEPSCEPKRLGSYASTSSLDFDGDGVVDTQDNCPKVFNPIRPVDHGIQADMDKDGVGDACDICPAGDEGNACLKAKEEDRDHDLIPDYKDNCPLQANSDQADFDQDGRGDACDPCASLSNPDLAACPVSSLRLLKKPAQGLSAIQLKAKVQLKGLVTALAPTGFYLQDEGPSMSLTNAEGPSAPFGIFVYQPKGQKPGLGQKISLLATYDQFKGLYQLQDLSSFQILAEQQSLPALSLGAAMWKDAARLDELEGVLVTTAVSGLVSYPSAADNSDGSIAFLFDGELAVGLALGPYAIPLRGSEVTVTGVLRKFANRFYIEPRQQDDIRVLSAGLPYLLGFSSPQVFTELGYTGVTSPELSLILDRAAPEDQLISLSSSHPETLALAASIIVPKDATRVSLPAFTTLQGSAEPIVITAKLHNVSAETQVYILENPKPQLLALEKTEWRSGVGASLRLKLRSDVPASLLGQGEALELNYDKNAVELLNTPVLAPGKQEVEVNLRGLIAGRTTIKASLLGSTISWDLILVAQDIALSEIFYDPMGDDNGQEWIEIINTSGREIDLSNYALGAGGESYATLRYQLKGLLAPGACAVVGGPKSLPSNFSPNFFQAEPFAGGLQNGGTVADAIGLFALKAIDIKADSLPLDAFIYGADENKAGFRLPDGSIGKVHLNKALSGQSAEKIDGNWVTQSQPTPGVCRGFASGS